MAEGAGEMIYIHSFICNTNCLHHGLIASSSTCTNSILHLSIFRSPIACLDNQVCYLLESSRIGSVEAAQS